MTTLQQVAVITGIALAILRFAPAIFNPIAVYAMSGYTAVLDFTYWSVGRLHRIAGLVIVLSALGSMTALNIYLFDTKFDLPDLDPVINYRPQQAGIFYDDKGGKVIEIAEVYRKPITYDELPAIVHHAIIAAEDKRYYEHRGIDFTAIPRVLLNNVRGNTQGGSSITQQVARNIFLKKELARERAGEMVVDNTLTRIMSEHIGLYWTNKAARKTAEGKISVNLEPSLTTHFESKEVATDAWDFIVDGPRSRARLKMKDHLLAIYASEIYLGRGAYGFPYGARKFFNKSIFELTVAESALLASFIPFPGPYSYLPAETDLREQKLLVMKSRRDAIIVRMYNNHFITMEELAAAIGTPVDIVEPHEGSKTDAPAAVHQAFKEVTELGIAYDQITDGFAHPHLTLNPDIQDAVNRGVRAGMENFQTRWPDQDMPQMAVVVLKNSNASILGIYGGHLENSVNDYSFFNRATMAVRQPGSTFKGIDFLAAVRNGITPSTRFDDKPYCINMGRGRGFHCVSNFDGRFKGSMSVREIIAQSRNTATLHMVDSMRDPERPGHKGIDEVIETARLLGLTNEFHRYTVTALGSDGVIPLQFANAYRAIASGISAEPYIVQQVTDEQGAILAHHTSVPVPLAIAPSHLQTVQELLRGTVRIPGGTGGALRNFHVPCAGKTGTSNDHKDAWFVCFTYGTEGITVLAWVGYDEFGRSLPYKGRPRATGGTAALPIVKAILDDVYGENKTLGEPPQFPQEVESNISEHIYWSRTFPSLIQ